MGAVDMDHLGIVRELGRCYDAARGEPLQFRTVLTGSQYLPLYGLVERHARSGLSVLDWGSGNGHFSYFLLRLGLDVTAFNLESQDCALADVLRARFGERYRLEFGADDEPARLPFADRSFDMACSIGVLEHVRESGGSELASLAELRRVLKPGGLFLCGMLPTRYSWIEFLVRNFFKWKHHHRYRYTERDIGGLLNRSGFELIELGTHGFLPRNSLNRTALAGLTGRPTAVRLFNLVDRALAAGLPVIAQNFMLCARSLPPSSSETKGRASREFVR
jgi:SAM-dependent methyltransferase